MSFDNLTTQTPTTLGSWVLLVAQAIDSYGLDSDQIFKEAGIDLADIKKNGTRFPTAMMIKVWKIAVLRTQDPYIGIRVAKFFRPTAYSALGMAMTSSRHVYDAIYRCTRYSRIISDSTIASMEENEIDVSFVLRPRTDFKSSTYIYGMSATLCCMFRIFREVAGQSLKVKEVHFEQSLPSTKPLEEYFSCPVFYGSDCNKIVFDKKYIFTEQPFAHYELTCSLDEWIEEYLSQCQEVKTSSHVENLILKHLSYGELAQPRVARDLAMSSRMLQRKLNEEGTSYTKLLNDIRKELAIKLILKNKLSLSEVSFLVGYNNQSNFNRAFKRWTGTTPMQYPV